MLPPLLESFINDLLVEAHLESMPDDVKEAYTIKVAEAIEKRLGLESLKVLQKKDIQEMNQRMTDGKLADSEAMFAFFQEKISDFDAFLARILLEFRKDFVQSAQQARNIQKTSS